MDSLLDLAARFDLMARCELSPEGIGAMIDEGYPVGSLLHRAVLAQNRETVSILLQRGVDPRVPDAEGLTPLQRLTTSFPEVAADVETADKQGHWMDLATLLAAAAARHEAMDAVGQMSPPAGLRGSQPVRSAPAVGSCP